MPNPNPQYAQGKRFQIVTRDEFEVANGEAVVRTLKEHYQIDQFDLLNAMRGQVYMGEDHMPLYVYMYDGSSAKDGVVEAPTFYLGTEEDYDEENRVYGPITWSWTDGDQLLENWKTEDPLPGFTAFEAMIKDTNK